MELLFRVREAAGSKCSVNSQLMVIKLWPISMRAVLSTSSRTPHAKTTQEARLAADEARIAAEEARSNG
jgi:hypothetical protein